MSLQRLSMKLKTNLFRGKVNKKMNEIFVPPLLMMLSLKCKVWKEKLNSEGKSSCCFRVKYTYLSCEVFSLSFVNLAAKADILRVLWENVKAEYNLSERSNSWSFCYAVFATVYVGCLCVSDWCSTCTWRVFIGWNSIDALKISYGEFWKLTNVRSITCPNVQILLRWHVTFGIADKPRSLWQILVTG